MVFLAKSVTPQSVCSFTRVSDIASSCQQRYAERSGDTGNLHPVSYSKNEDLYIKLADNAISDMLLGPTADNREPPSYNYRSPPVREYLPYLSMSIYPALDD